MFLVTITQKRDRLIHSGAGRNLIGSVFASLHDMTSEYNEQLLEDDDGSS